MIRLATMDDISTLNNLINISARSLGQNDYSPEELEGAITHVFGVDSELVEDQTYYVIESQGVLMACGGWSRRKTLFGGNQFSGRESGYLDPKQEAAKIRAFFVHPDYARQGLGKKLLAYCETQAMAYGYSKIEMMATLTGVKLYETQGYLSMGQEQYLLPNGLNFRFVRMTKNIG
jgi:GNAT superfamily N-acetyltransferase